MDTGRSDQDMPDQQRRRRATHVPDDVNPARQQHPPGFTLDADNKSLVDSILDEFKADTPADMHKANSSLVVQLEKKIEGTLRKYDKAIQARFNIIDEDPFGLNDQISKLEAES